MAPKSKFKSKAAEWTEDLALYLKDFSLAKFVYDAIQKKNKFQLVVNGTVLYARPKGTTSACGSTTIWTSKDMEWDDQGCLTILDKKLGDLVKDARSTGTPFRIEVPMDAVVPPPIAPKKKGGGIGENKINAMCVC